MSLRRGRLLEDTHVYSLLNEREVPAIAGLDESLVGCVSENDSAASDRMNDGLRPCDYDCAVMIDGE